jgi:hypothetical protein
MRRGANIGDACPAKAVAREAAAGGSENLLALQLVLSWIDLAHCETP